MILGIKIEPKKDLIRLAVVVAAAFLMALNVKSFIRTGGLFPGGVSGLTLLIQRALLRFTGIEIPYSILNILLNIGPIWIGFRFIGKKFTLFSLLMIVLNGFFVDLIPGFALTYDTLLISIFGGIINGAATSMCLAVDATSGGTDFISIFMSLRRGLDSFNIILAFNACILVVAGLLFGWDKALYSIIFQFVSTQVIHLLFKTYQQQTLFVVTDRAPEICEEIHRVSHHGATIMQAEGSYENASRQVVYSVVSGAQTRKVIAAVRKVDPGAFINSIKTSEVRGNFYQNPKD